VDFLLVSSAMMSLATLISTYGYAAIAIGTFFEGETVLVLAGFVASRGYLELTWVVICGFLGTLCGDQLCFYLGRAQGTKVLEKRPYWRSKSKRVFHLLHKNRFLVVLGFRFFYGLRSIIPFLLGASGISRIFFLFSNILGAFVWAITIGISGYLFGHAFELVIGDIEKYELQLLLVLAALGSVVWGLHWLRKQKLSRQADALEK
jgi:membrane protein DedA with SNARE-associated domain